MYDAQWVGTTARVDATVRGRTRLSDLLTFGGDSQATTRDADRPMTLSARDPLFDRYQAAWMAYLSVQRARLAAGLDGSIPYRLAALDDSDSEMQSAAFELRTAREAFLDDLEPVPLPDRSPRPR